jgi:exportin-2 (importin alpha re-exporter)
MRSILQAYTRKAPVEVAQSIAGILGVFQKLISSRTTEAYGFSLLRGIFGFMAREAYGNFLNEIVKILMIRLQTRMSGRNSVGYTKDLVYTVSVLVGKVGPDVFVGSLEALQQGYATITTMVVGVASLLMALWLDV